MGLHRLCSLINLLRKAMTRSHVTLSSFLSFSRANRSGLHVILGDVKTEPPVSSLERTCEKIQEYFRSHLPSLFFHEKTQILFLLTLSLSLSISFSFFSSLLSSLFLSLSLPLSLYLYLYLSFCLPLSRRKISPGITRDFRHQNHI